jgi:putative NIF3 family GTP cyclohydrolase 1 type 2
VGDLTEPTTVAAFADRVRDRLPRTPSGVRVSGDPARAVGRVAVCGGAGDRLVQAAASAGADVFVTSDLRHHPALENVVDGGPALVDAGHFATEWPWLPVAAERLAADAREHGTTVEVRVSSLVTDPWTALVPSSSKEQL